MYVHIWYICDKIKNKGIEKCETDKPDIVLRSIRQFMSGTKNYLLNKREPEIDAVIDRVSTHQQKIQECLF